MTTPYPQQPPPGQWGQADAPQPGAYGQTPPPPPSPYGQTPPPPPGDTGGQSAIAITLKFFPLAWIFALITPKLFLNGQPVGVRWGRNVLPVAPGQHNLHLHVPYFLPPKVGPADLTVPVAPGQTVELEYRAPVWTFSRGSLGPPPQKYNGVGITIGIIVASFVFVCLCCVGSALLSNA